MHGVAIIGQNVKLLQMLVYCIVLYICIAEPNER